MITAGVASCLPLMKKGATCSVVILHTPGRQVQEPPWLLCLLSWCRSHARTTDGMLSHAAFQRSQGSKLTFTHSAISLTSCIILSSVPLMWMGVCQRLCLEITCVPGALQGQKSSSDPRAGVTDGWEPLPSFYLSSGDPNSTCYSLQGHWAISQFSLLSCCPLSFTIIYVFIYKR